MAHVLLAEDDEGIRDFVCLALEGDNHEVVATRNGEEALEILKSGADGFDILIADIQMPGMDGIELAKMAAVENAEMSILLISGVINQLQRAENIEGLVQGILHKPFTLEQIRNEVIDIVGQPDPTEVEMEEAS